jgi:hypothetical protein
VDTNPLPGKHNALIANPSLGITRIIFPHHPNCGQDVEVLEVIGGLQPHLVGRLTDGKTCRLALSWTDWEAPGAEDSSTTEHLVSVEALQKIADKLREIKQRGESNT